MNALPSPLLLIGIGGAGAWMTRGILRAYGSGIRALVLDTDAQSGATGDLPFMLLGGNRLAGRGTGGQPASARAAFQDNPALIDPALEGVRTAVLVTALGGGTGGGATGELLKHLHTLGIVTLLFATTPFSFEGEDRIRSAKTAAGPKRDWMQIVKTNGARTKIKQWFKKERRDENIEQGKAALDRELRANLLYDAFQQPELQNLILKRLEMPDLTELYASLGYGGIAMSRVIAKVRDELQRQRAAEQKEAKLEAKLAAQTARAQRSVADTGVIVEGLDNCLVKFAKCCSPLPGDPIIGFVTRGYGVSVHRQDCANVRAALQNKPDDGRWIRTEWAMNERHQYSAGIRVTTKSRVGAITDVLTVLTNMKINVSEMNAKEMDDGQCDLFLTITVSDAEQMELVLSRILRANGVIQARRIVAGS